MITFGCLEAMREMEAEGTTREDELDGAMLELESRGGL